MSKPHICDVCFRNFNDSSNLKRHMIQHNPGLKAALREKYKCPECEATFTTKRDLNHHAIQHNPALKAEVREKYKCPECQAKFTTRGNLNQHRILHNPQLIAEMREKYKCPTCRATFTLKGNLNQHVKKQHHPDSKVDDIDLDMAQWLVDLGNVPNQEEMDIAQQLVDLGRIHPTQSIIPASHSSSGSDRQQFTCEYCDGSYDTSAGLQSHMFIHTNNT